MYCPECNGKTGVAETKAIELNMYRRRVCKECGYKFYTEETEIEDMSAFRYCWANARREHRRCKSDSRGSQGNN